MQFSKVAQLLLLMAIALKLGSCSDCRTDPRCKTCSVLLFTSGLGTYFIYFCQQCNSNSIADSSTNICQCNSGYYPNTNSSCKACSIGCEQCTNSTHCLTCKSTVNRQLSRNKCECIDDYEEKDDEEACYQKPNILMIVLSVIGSIICVVVGAILCALIRMRRGAHQVHAQKKKKRRNSQNIEIQIYEGYEGMENTSNLFWNTKSYEYKKEQLCSICLDSYPLFITECGHYFHDKCIYSWLQNKTSCPNCNSEIEAKDIRRWCSRCKKVLMPVIRSVVIKKIGKRKKQLVQSTPIENQICDGCENQTNSQSISNDLEQISPTKSEKPEQS